MILLIEVHIATAFSALSVLIAATALITTLIRLSKANTKDSSAEIENIKVRLKQQEKRFEREEKNIDDNRMAIERIEEMNRNINRRLDAIDALKLDAKLAEMQTDLKHIRALIENK